MTAKFEVRQQDTGEFRWVLVSQGRVLATSEPYTRKAYCLNAIESLRKAAPTAPVTETANGAAPAAKAAPATRRAATTATQASAVSKAATSAGRSVSKPKATAADTVAKTEKAVTPKKRPARTR